MGGITHTWVANSSVDGNLCGGRWVSTPWHENDALAKVEGPSLMEKIREGARKALEEEQQQAPEAQRLNSDRKLRWYW